MPLRRTLLGLAGAGLFLAALDTYAVVTLLPQMLQAVDLPIDHIEAAAPILTGFLVGYVVAMPLLGAFSDVRGRLPAYSAAIGVFGLGSAITALAPGLAWLVLGRVLQGLGGGAMVPLTLALAADLFTGGRRSLAVGTVSGLQEAGSVVGPVYGAVLAADAGSWRTVFWLNLPLGGLLLTGLWLSVRAHAGTSLADDARVRQRSTGDADDVDWLGAGLLGLGLGLVVLTFYPDDPGNRAVNAHALPFGMAAAGSLVGFAWRQSRRLTPLISPALLRSRTFVGAMTANLLAGGGLMVALVDVPILARGVFGLSTIDSGLLLSRFLLGVPFGAVVGGWVAGRIGQRWTAAAGLLLAGGAFALMSEWNLQVLRSSAGLASAELVACGTGFGLVIAPLSTAVLDQARGRRHGLASSLIVLSRTVGMVLALATLTAFGLARLQRILAQQHCETAAAGGSLRDQLAAYETCVRGALLQEYREIFLMAAAICLLAMVITLISLPGRPRTPFQLAPAPPAPPAAVPD